MICLEKYEDTLDSYISNNDVDYDEWVGILFQIVITLASYQKIFSFTHNDLHTNNIMFVNTDKKYLIYQFNGSYYKVKTFGKIWKIIDFGRAIYKFKGKTLCSNSFAPDGDAATQYNCEPYINNNKPRIEPNFSFDLCRLGCSLFEFLLDDIEDLDDDSGLDDLQKIVLKWCKDDKGKNVLFKKSGEERYPEFKLYKMIARTVHNHIPEKELKNTLFKDIITSKKKINNKSKIIKIDDIPLLQN